MFGKVWELKKMYDKYKTLQKALKNLVIRWKEGKYIDANGDEVEGAVVVDISGEMKLKDFKINDISYLDPSKKEALEKIVMVCFLKAQNKAQEIVWEKTKDILWFDPSNMWNMLGGGGMPGMN